MIAGFTLALCSLIAAGSGAKRLDCYPKVAQKPGVTEELCLAQGCSWNASEETVKCAFREDAELPLQSECGALSYASRMDCRNPRYLQHVALSEQTCKQMGCCFDAAAPAGTLRCFQSRSYGYDVKYLSETDFGWQGTLVLPAGKRGPFGNDIKTLTLQVFLLSDSQLRVKIIDPAHIRYEVKDIVNPERHSARLNTAQYDISFTRQPFGLSVSRKSTGEVLFNSTPPATTPSFSGLVYENQYLEFSTHLGVASPRLFGFGEQVSPFELAVSGPSGQHYTLFAADRLAGLSQHKPEGGQNLYGVHPFHLQVKESGNAHGVFLLSSTAMEVVLQPSILTYRTIGGVLDFFIFLGPSPNQVVSQYQALVGKPALPPYWALGTHVSKWGYNSLEATRLVVERLRAAGVPQEAQWNDIDSMDGNRDFTLSSGFPADRMRQFVDDLHAHGQKYVNILDPGVAWQSIQDRMSEYPAYRRGKEANVFIKDHVSKDLISLAWPGATVFPDFTHPNVSEWLTREIKDFHDLVGFDGMWVDMNEPATFCNGEAPYGCLSPDVFCSANRHACDSMVPVTGNLPTEPSPDYRKSPDVQFPFDPFRQPFVPGQNQQTASGQPYGAQPHGEYGAGQIELTTRGYPYVSGGEGDLDFRTLSMAAMQHSSIHYNVHSLYGHSQLKVTSKALSEIRGKRPLVVGRSTYAGSGSFAAHWLGDNFASWENMRDSIPGILSMNMFGIPLVGADVCGFFGSTTKELCIRWQQLGSFYPFSRNHNNANVIDQTPVDFDEEALVIIRSALLERYRLLPHLYTLFYKAHISGETVARPLHFEFPSDPATAAINEQFLWGSSLLVSPVLYEGRNFVNAYFPDALWYDLWTGRLPGEEHPLPGRVVLEAPLNKINVHVRGGSIIPMQEPSTTTIASRRQPFQLLIALDDHMTATGTLYLDDGESLGTLEQDAYAVIDFHASVVNGSSLIVSCVVRHEPAHLNGYEPPVIQSMKIYSSRRFAAVSRDVVGHTAAAATSSGDGVLMVNDLGLPVNAEFLIKTEVGPAPPYKLILIWPLLVTGGLGVLVAGGVVRFLCVRIKTARASGEGYQRI